MSGSRKRDDAVERGDEAEEARSERSPVFGIRMNALLIRPNGT
jgi:hypothetical protein